MIFITVRSLPAQETAGGAEGQSLDNNVLVLLSHINAHFNEEVAAYKSRLDINSSDVSEADKIVYRFLINQLRYSRAGKLSPHSLKEFLVRQKYSLVQEEALLLRLLQDDKALKDFDHEGILNLKVDFLNTLADVGWEGASILEHPHMKPAPPQGQNPGTSTAPTTSAVTLAGLLNMGSSGLGLGLTFLEGANYLAHYGSFWKARRESQRVEKSIAILESKIKRAKAMPSKLQLLKLEQFELEQKQLLLKKRLEHKGRQLGEMKSSLTFNGIISSSYFSSSSMSMFAPASVSMGVASGVMGGVLFGGILTYLGFKGLYNGHSAFTSIKNEISAVRGKLVQVTPLRQAPSRLESLRYLYYMLRLKHLRLYDTRLQRWIRAKDLLNVGLGTASTVSGSLATAAALGATGVTTAAVAGTGYGAIALLGGSLVCGGVIMNKKYHWVERVKDLLERKFHLAPKQEKKIFPYQLEAKIQLKMKRYKKLIRSMENLALKHSRLLYAESEADQLREVYLKMQQNAQEISQILLEVEQLQIALAPLKLFQELPTKGSKEMGQQLMELVGQLKDEEIKELGGELNFSAEFLNRIPEGEKRRDYIKAIISNGIIDTPGS